MEQVVKLDGPVTGFHVTQEHIHCMCGKELLKIRKASGEILFRRQFFEKEGLSRKLKGDGGQLFVYDFCTFYAFSQEDYALLGKWRLGEDLRSDICGMAVEEDAIYCAIRNGKLTTLHRRSGAWKEYMVSGSSMWSLRPYGSRLVCGTVEGKLLVLDKAGLSLERELVLGKKNIASLYLDGGALFAACQDGKLFRIDMKTLEVEAERKNAHRKMFRCAGIFNDMLVTVSHPCSEIAFWDRGALEEVRRVPVPLQLSGQAWIENNSMYLSSRNIMGIGKVNLQEQSF